MEFQFLDTCLWTAQQNKKGCLMPTQHLIRNNNNKNHIRSHSFPASSVVCVVFRSSRIQCYYQGALVKHSINTNTHAASAQIHARASTYTLVWTTRVLCSYAYEVKGVALYTNTQCAEQNFSLKSDKLFFLIATKVPHDIQPPNILWN